MTLDEFLKYCKTEYKGKTVRVFVGCMTIYKGSLHVIYTHKWIKVKPYLNCKVLDHKVINDTVVITI